MTWKEKAKELGVTDRALRNYRKEESFPADGILKEMVVWIAQHGGNTSYLDFNPEDEDTKALRDQKLKGEILKLQLANGEKTEEILQGGLEQMANESRQFFTILKTEIGACKLPRKEAKKLNQAISASLKLVDSLKK
jgi:predicted transcriptional regulator